jgi:hypothetical protein
MVAAVVLVGLGCGDDDGSIPGVDAGGRDAATPSDSGVADDAGSSLDAGEVADGATMPHDGGEDVDAGVDARDSACGRTITDAIFCTGFEDDPLPAGWLTGMGGDGARVTDNVFRGVGALRTESTETGGAQMLWQDVLGGITSGSIYARAYMYVPSGMTTNVAILSLGQGESPFQNISLSLANETNIGAWVRTGGDAVSIAPAGATFPRDTWACLQLEVAVSNTAGRVRFSVNGELQGERGGLDTLPTGPGYSAFTAGVQWTPPDHPPGPTIYIDEIAVGTSPIPCD